VEGIREAARGANVVLVVIDAARADHLGCYGYPRDTTPNMDRLAGESVRFEGHFCQFPRTKESTASLFASQYSDSHLASGNRHLMDGTFTMAKGLGEAGYRTVLFSSNPNASPGAGIGLDFRETYDQGDVDPLVRSWKELTSPEPLLGLIGDWLGRNGGSRFFAYIHFDPPHQPYIQPEEMTALFAGQEPPDFEAGDFAFPVGDREVLGSAADVPAPAAAGMDQPVRREPAVCGLGGGGGGAIAAGCGGLR